MPRVRVKEDGQGGFVAETDEVQVHLDKCTRCKQPMSDRVTLPLRLAGVRHKALLSSPSGPLCLECLDAEVNSW